MLRAIDAAMFTLIVSKAARGILLPPEVFQNTRSEKVCCKKVEKSKHRRLIKVLIRPRGPPTINTAIAKA